MQIKLAAFGGEIPRVNKRILPDTQAQIATNCDLLSGSIRNVNDDLLIESVDLDPLTQSIYNYNWNGQDNWLQWTEDVDVVKSPIVGDQYSRIYYTGNGAPRIRAVLLRENAKYYLSNFVVQWSKTNINTYAAISLLYAIRENNKAYSIGTTLQWANDSATIWQATHAGTSAASPPSIVGIAIGGSVTDGTVTWKRLALSDRYGSGGGRTATTAPDVSAVLVGGEVVDGSVTWTRLPDSTTELRESSHYYNVNHAVKWSTGDTYYKCIVAGTTAATPPDITDIKIGMAVTDGTAVWLKIYPFVSSQQDSLLGLPKPSSKTTVIPTDKTATSWIPTWTGWWEELDGTKKEEHVYPYKVGTTTYSPPTQVTAGITYSLAAANIWNKPTGMSDSARFVVMMQASSTSGKLLGRVFPNVSFYAASSDLYINSAKVSAVTTLITTTKATITITLSYDLTAATEYISDRSYVYTYVDIMGEEGPPSDPSDVVAIGPNIDAALKGIDVVYGKDYGTGYQQPVLIRIYRTVTSSAGTNYQFVAEIDAFTGNWKSTRAYRASEVVFYNSERYQALIANTNIVPSNPSTWLKLATDVKFQDNITDAEVGEVIPSIGWSAPGANYKGLVYIPGGFFAAFDGKTIYFSESNQPHAWPPAYGQTIEDEIVGLGVAENTLAILTEKFPYLCTVQTPDQPYISKLSAPQSCVSKRSIVENGGAIIYASQDGICVITGATVSISTLGLFTKDQWFSYRWTGTEDVLDDSKTQCFVNDQYIYVNTINRSFRYRIGDNQIAIVELGSHFYGYFDDRAKDDLYIIKMTHDFGRRLFKLSEDPAYLQTTWQSKEFVLPLPQKWMLARITATNYPITFQLFTSDSTTPIANLSVQNNKAFRLPYVGRYKFWSVKAVMPYSAEANEITEILIGTNFSDL